MQTVSRCSLNAENMMVYCLGWLGTTSLIGGHSPQAAQVIRRMTVPSLSVLPFLENAFVPEHLHFFSYLDFLRPFQLSTFFGSHSFWMICTVFMINDPESLRSPLYDIPQKSIPKVFKCPFQFWTVWAFLKICCPPNLMLCHHVPNNDGHILEYICIFDYFFLSLSLYMYIYVCVCLHIHTYTYIYIYTCFAYIYIYVCMYVYMYVCIDAIPWYVYTYINILFQCLCYVYIYIYIISIISPTTKQH
jgi:hypothetical protein